MTGRYEAHILVVANETVASERLQDALLGLDFDYPSPRILVLAPALNSRLRHWLSDDDAARQRATERLRVCLDGLHAAGLDAEGLVGDADPLQAIGDALRLFPATEIVIATHPERRSNWLARDVVARACIQYELPVLHVTVDEPVAVPQAA